MLYAWHLKYVHNDVVYFLQYLPFFTTVTLYVYINNFLYSRYKIQFSLKNIHKTQCNSFFAWDRKKQTNGITYTNVKTWLLSHPIEFVLTIIIPIILTTCLEIQTYIKGPHVYKDIWIPEIGEQLKVRIEPDNCVASMLFTWKRIKKLLDI